MRSSAFWSAIGATTAVLLASAPVRAQFTCPYPNQAQNFTVEPPYGSGFVGVVGTPFQRMITVSGGGKQYFWQLTAERFPPGLGMRKLGDTPENVNYNYIEGTPTAAAFVPGERAYETFVGLCIYPYPMGYCLGTCGKYHFRILLPPDGGAADGGGAGPAGDGSAGDGPAAADGGADAPVDAPPDAPMDTPSPDGPRDTSPDLPMCLMPQEKCSSSSECCMGLKCESPPGTTGGPVCCTQDKTSCKSDRDCCSQLFCRAGVCSACGEKGGPCASDSACCSPLRCEQGSCSDCARDGESCERTKCCAKLGCSVTTFRCEPTCSKQGEPCGEGCCVGFACRASDNTCQPVCSKALEPCRSGCCAGLRCIASGAPGGTGDLCISCRGKDARCDFPTDCCEGLVCESQRCAPASKDACDCALGQPHRTGGSFPLVGLAGLALSIAMLARGRRRRPPG